jgi:hypothetical protein
MPSQKYEVLSPDGFDIRMDGIWDSPEEDHLDGAI